MSALEGMVVSVGGAAAPIRAAIDEAGPRFVLFVVSSDSRPLVEGEILAGISRTPPQWECLTISDHEDIVVCYREIRRGLAGWLQRRDLQDSDVAADVTGGTKAMTAALALAAVERLSTLQYVGGDKRDKEGLGVVVDGSERVLVRKNPWNTYAVRDLERAAALVRESHADLAAEALRTAAKRCDGTMAVRVQVLSWLLGSFACADRFDFKGAIISYGKCRKQVPFVLGDALLGDAEKTFENWRLLREQTRDDSRTPGRETVLELIANADRRARQCRYDDAVGRLYRAVELHAQGLARNAFGDELGKLRLRSLPSNKRDWMRREYGDAGDSYKLGIEALFRVLERCGKLPSKQADTYVRLKKHLQKRNSSLFAHGSIPVKEDDYRQFRDAVQKELSVAKDEIPVWPNLANVLEQVQ